MLVPQVGYTDDLPRTQQTFSVELAWTDTLALENHADSLIS